ncbi:hypothetical protein [Chromobacterium sp.]|uniref:hypothetical protein n=1 Tax=Chromobacterium sp. TaxID=306190 RepID=UPI0035AE2495
MKAFHIDLQQPRTRRRLMLSVLAATLPQALERAALARPGFLIFGWKRVKK